MKNKIGNNAKAILSHLNLNGPTKRGTLLSLVKPAGTYKTWGNSFFLLTFTSGNGAGASLLARGYAVRVGHGMYDITPKGKEVLAS